jgi:hypothetical protein
MHPSILFFVLLFLPNTTLRDWQNADTPTLHQLMSDGALALMNANTAEKDTITTDAAERTIYAGVPQFGRDHLGGAGYSRVTDNLADGLVNSGVDIAGASPIAPAPPPFFMPPSDKQFLAANLSGTWPQIDEQIQQFSTLVNNRHGILMIVSPNPDASDYKVRRRLTPVLLWGAGIPKGYLQSNLTKTIGLITNVDLAPTIAKIMGATLPLPVDGMPVMVSATSENKAVTLLQRDERWIQQSYTQSLMPYLAGIVAVLVLFAVTYTQGRKKVGAGIVAALTMVPLALLLGSNIPVTAILLAIGLLIGLKALLPDDTSPFTALSIVIFLLIDSYFFAGRLSGASALGYCPIDGLRYHGIGSEVMGAYIGALAVLTGLWDWKGEHRRPLILLWIIAALSLSLPFAGGQPGGLIACAAVLAGYVMVGKGAKLTQVKTVLAILTAGILAFAILLAFHQFGAKDNVPSTFVGTGGFRGILQDAGLDIHVRAFSMWIVILVLTSIGRVQLSRKDTMSAVGTVATIACLLCDSNGAAAAAICSLTVWAGEFNRVIKVAPVSDKNQTEPLQT